MDNIHLPDGFFQFQIDILMKEIDLIDHAIGRLDEILLRNRNWGTTLWAGLIAIILQGETFDRRLLLATALIPLLFWLIDIRWKMALIRCSGRMKRIFSFLNSEALKEAFEQRQIRSIELLDPVGEHLPARERDYFVRAIGYKDTYIFYPVQILGSLVLFLFL
jgi:hypothetical protein